MPDEGPAHIAAWAKTRGHELHITRWFEPVIVAPDLSATDLLVVLGGAMGVHDEEEFPWLRLEKNAIQTALGSGKPVLGLCLGSQLIAQLLGATVGRNPEPEVGFWPVEFTAEARQTPQLGHLPAEVMALHWHYDAFTLPPGAQLLATSAATSCQGFLWQDRVIGLQFHPEADAAWLASLVGAEGHLLGSGTYVQTVPEIQNHRALLGQSPAFLFPLLDGMLALA
ncbi:type 1 glutamine amidotransferase [Hymenobacter gelipurpurascens]|nr:type 1 glutamine amidotransferase [Hymenobacter gelipurpurascens]